MLQKQMADMLMMQDSTEEKMIGFAASEKARLSKAWGWSLLYIRNSKSERRMADAFTYLMLFLNLLIVCLIVYKTVAFPCRTEDPWGSDDDASVTVNASRRLEEIVDAALRDEGSCYCEDGLSGARRRLQLSAAQVAYHQSQLNGQPKSDWEKVLDLLLVILPVVTGILLTFNNAFNPIQKFNALRWASAACESEIYTYRARARSYSAVVASHEWDFDNESQEPSEEEKRANKPSKKFVERLNAISQTVHSETQLQTSSLKYFRDSSQESLIQRKVDKLQRRTCMTETDEVSILPFPPWLFTVPSP